MCLCGTTCVTLKSDKTTSIGIDCSTICWEKVGGAVFAYTVYQWQCFCDLDLDLLTQKMGFQDSVWNILCLVWWFWHLGFSYIVQKDRQTDVKTLHSQLPSAWAIGSFRWHWIITDDHKVIPILTHKNPGVQYNIMHIVCNNTNTPDHGRTLVIISKYVMLQIFI